MSESLKLLLADARYPSGDLAHSGGVEAACAAGLVKDLETLRSFLYGRLWSAGVVGAVASAAVCARTRTSESNSALFRSVEAELDARLPSPASREVSRLQGGLLLRLGMTITHSPVFDTLARSSVTTRQRPHYPTAVGAVAAVAGATVEEAAEAAAYASVAGPAFAAQSLLDVDLDDITEMGVEMAPEVARIAREASEACMRPLSQMPAYGAPALEYLAEEHVSRVQKSFAS